MGKYFEIGSVSLYHIIAIVVPIFYMLTYYLLKYQLKYYNNRLKKENNCTQQNDEKNSNCKIREFPFYFNIFISKTLSIILIFIRKYRNENNKLKKLETKSIRRYHLSVNNKYRKIKSCILIIVISIFEIVFTFESYATYNTPNYIELKLGIIILVPILSVFIFKKQIYKHHIMSFILSFIGIILVCLTILFMNDNNNIEETIIPVLGEQMRHLFFSIYLSLALVLTKYLFENSFINPFEFILFNGLLCIFVPLILISLKAIFINTLGLSYFKDNLKGLLLLFNDIYSILFFIGVIFVSFCYYVTNALTIYIFNPTLLVSTDTLSPFFSWIIELIILFFFFKDSFDKKKENENLYLVIPFKLIGFLIIIFSALVYNEILILHFLNFDKNIRKNIEDRGDNELNDKNPKNTMNETIESVSDSSFELELSNV